MVCLMTWEQFKVLADVFQEHLRNTHHIEVPLIGIPALVLGYLYLKEFRLARMALEAIADALRLR